MVVNVVLFEPEIPPNTGNIVRTCAATGFRLHLIEPLGFSLSDRYLKRAGLDYWGDADISVHRDFRAFVDAEKPDSLYALSTKGKKTYRDMELSEQPYLLFGPETRGLPSEILRNPGVTVFRIPMQKGIRSLNLSNAVAIVAYDILRRLDFPGLT